MDVVTASGLSGREQVVSTVDLFACVLREVDHRVRTALVEQGHARLSESESVMLRAAASGVQHRAEYLHLLGVTQQAVSKSLRRLEHLGYVQARADPADLRVRLMRPTSWGHQRLRLIDQVHDDVGAQLRSATGGVALEYETRLRDWLDRFARQGRER